MAAIAEQAEKDKMRENDIPVPLSNDCNVSEFLAKQAIESTERLGVRGIITDSYTDAQHATWRLSAVLTPYSPSA